MARRSHHPGRDARSITSRNIRYPAVTKKRLSRYNYYDRLPAFMFTRPSPLQPRVQRRRLVRRVIRRVTLLQMVEDRRQYTPEPRRPLKTVWGHQGVSLREAYPTSRLTRSGALELARRAAKSRAFGPASLPFGLAFKAPRRVAVCVRRKQRREVILALGKGGGGNRRPRFNEYSTIRC